ncbi:sulfite exporter TauE/SafE [Mariprofundus micogutta]|uniref:Probable membrane transporter protein n=1 Tax=Mariprofundus micogutta TaxID=1921010 RepID=A0A1L8CMX6_9PROT|nr:sulfite exporter TauE/SafE family protein [Mariprofundus micogutta]GAV20244.1 sulfite exporter TauE/SafE [Mariprofundus micogutta]
MPEFDLNLIVYGLAVGLAAGLIGGMLAGLAGVGGGLVYVPLFYALMPDIDKGISMHVFASMVAIVITGLFSARAHWRLQHVNIPGLTQLLPGLIIGAALGLWSTLHIDEIWVLLCLSLLNAWVAYDYGKRIKPAKSEAPSLHLLSGPIGYISGFLGIGGGTMLVPLLRRHIKLRLAVGTSAVAGAVMAASAVTINVTLETSWQLQFSAHREFLLSAWLGILLILPASSTWAAALHTSVAELSLRMILKSIFIALSAGLFIAALLAGL